MIEKVNTFTDEHALFEGVRSAVIGVSGGADSMCLLDLLHRYTDLSLTVVHVHHGIRGAEAERDADFVRRICTDRKLPLFIVRADVPSIASAEQCGIEETGRKVRYAVFRHIQQQVGADCIVTAHTASDQVETVLHNIIRGCGLSGLSGMMPYSDGVVRPLLCCTRSEIEQYCAENNISFVTDSTNADVTYTRNSLRNTVLPLLRMLNPSVDDALLRLADAAGDDETLLTDYAEQKRQEAMLDNGAYDRQILLELPKSIRYRVLRLALSKIGCRSMEYRHFTVFDGMLIGGSGGIQLPGCYSLRVRNDNVYAEFNEMRVGAPSPTHELLVNNLPFSAVFGEYIIRMSVESRVSIANFKNVHKMFFKFTLDYDKINSGLYWRTRKVGDYMHPAGRHIGKSVKSLMSEWHMTDRDNYPLLCDDDGVVMVPEYCCDERVRTDEHTNHFLVCCIEKVSL